MEELASIIIVTFRQARYIQACLDSISKQKYPHEVIIVDNNSNDGIDRLIKNDPNIIFIQNKENSGYGMGNNLGVTFAKGKYVIFLNPDTVVEDEWLCNLIKPFDRLEKIITTPKILTYDGQAINTCGNINHFTGLSFTRGYLRKPTDFSQQEELSGFSGCCFAIKKEDFLNLGGFDKNFFIYNDDAELSWRAHSYGFQILLTPNSIIEHDYKLKITPEKIYHLEKGRYIILRKYFTKKQRCLLIFSLMLAEMFTFGYSIKVGPRGLNYKFKAIKDSMLLDIKPLKNDKTSLFKALNTEIPIEQLSYNRGDKILKILANYFFKWNYKLLL